MKYATLLFSAILLLSSCKKDHTDKDDFSGNGTLAGLLQYADTLTGEGKAIPLPNRKLYIAYAPSDTLNYLYSVTTDAQGYFVFQYLNKDTQYDIFFLDTVAGVRYLAYATLQPDQNDIAFTARRDTRQGSTLLVTTVTDDGSALPRASLYIYNNPQVALRDTSCSESIYQGTADAYGRYWRNDLPEGKYYVRAGYTADGRRYKGFDSVVVTPNNISPVRITLRPATATTGFRLVVYDNNGSPVNGSNICVFTNKTYFLADTCIGNIFTLTAGTYGEAVKTDINPGNYYLRTTAMFNGILHKNLDSVLVIKDSVVVKPIYLP